MIKKTFKYNLIKHIFFYLSLVILETYIFGYSGSKAINNNTVFILSVLFLFISIYIFYKLGSYFFTKNKNIINTIIIVFILVYSFISGAEILTDSILLSLYYTIMLGYILIFIYLFYKSGFFIKKK